MISAQLIANAKQQLLETLLDLSSVDRQRAYALAVPFVHVPIELAAQWEHHAELTQQQSWFRESLSPSQLEAVLDFDRHFRALLDSFDHELPDLDQLWPDSRWTKIGREAAKTLEVFSLLDQ